MQSQGTTSSQFLKNSSIRAPRIRAHKLKLQHIKDLRQAKMKKGMKIKKKGEYRNKIFLIKV